MSADQPVAHEPIPDDQLVGYWIGKMYAANMEMIRAARAAEKNHGITRSVIAARLKKNKAQISRLLNNGKKDISVRLLAEIAIATGSDLQIKLVPLEDVASITAPASGRAPAR